MVTSRHLAVGLLGLTCVIGAVLIWQWQAAEALRAEIALLREENLTVAKLRDERDRLRSGQVSPAELEQLRSDHAAVLRLRAELEGMKARANQRSEKEKAIERKEPPPALVLNLGWGADGKVAIDGSPLDLDFLRQRFGGLVARTDRVEIHVQMPSPDPQRNEELKRSIDGIKGIVREMKLGMTVRMERPGP